MYEIVFYEDKNGNSEISDYFEKISNSQQKQDKAIFKKLTHQMDMLEMLGTQLNEPQAKYLKHLKYPLWELRPMPERIFYGVWQGDKFVLLSHYTKKSNTTDPRELSKAMRLLQDWYERKGK
ncbi:type II toxin-antitoxin system RelE/ParE family toxin [Limosilactobacillus reuteri]|uniref:type II toxin-antitoxin system RelE/ParE family toxin n=3 Tax=Limosilactobacillus reuteri TaxID=1598 RepID=UPI002B05EC9B|nr:type II toxin-antitoxin system RelE/ParE family toxin [Limosilactobacillus reuteri]